MTRSDLNAIDFTLFEPPETEGYEIRVLYDDGWGLTIHAFYPNGTSFMLAQLFISEICNDEGVRNSFDRINTDGAPNGWHIGYTRVEEVLKVLEVIQRLKCFLWPNPETPRIVPPSPVSSLDRILSESHFDE
jgi:hypothetical protein